LAHGHFRIREQQHLPSDSEQQQQQQQQQRLVCSSNVIADQTTTMVVADEDELDNNHTVILSAAQSLQLDIRTHTHREALDSLAGSDLRREIAHAKSARHTVYEPTVKRPRVAQSDDDSDYLDDDSMRLVDEAAQFVALNGEF
jgi:hypothetical protein